MRTNLAAIAEQIASEGDAYAYLESLRWPTGQPTCPHCGGRNAWYIRPMNGHSRKTRTGAMSERRVWRCGDCRKQFSVLTGTIMHGTKIAVRKWVMVIFEMCSSKNGVAAREIERKYGVCARTAWFMCHRIREAMKSDPIAEAMRGVIVADETYIGGAEKNRHAWQRSNPGGGTRHMIPVLSLVERHTGEVRSRVIPDVTGATLRKAIEAQTDPGNSLLYTDAFASYNAVGREFVAHEIVDHSAGEYVRGDVTTNSVEGFFSQLKRSVHGTHHHVSRQHLPRYLAEFDFRYTTRRKSDAARMDVLMGRVGGRRLTYKGTIAG